MSSHVPLRIAGVLILLLAAQPALAATSNGIRINGANQYVTFGAAPSLGAPTFTIELWFKREGAGTTTSTGTGGHSAAIPLLTKGRGEVDGDNRDMNYFLGIRPSDNVLVADFEEGTGQAQPGLNHPIAGVTPIETGVWYHAAATFDGRNWRLYLNGALEREIVLASGHRPQASSIQHAALASALTSTGAAEGFFQGVLDEARIWDHARPAAGIHDSLTLQIPSAPGLVGRWALDLISGGVTANSVSGGVNGTVIGGATTTTGSPFTITVAQPPAAPTLVAPSNGATQVGLSPALSVNAFDPDGGPVSVSFYGRPVAVNNPAADFTLIGIPDTQYYTSSLNGGTPSMFDTQTNWIAANRASRNIAAVVHLGDCVEHGDASSTEWTNADRSMRKIESSSGTGLTYGIPYGVCVGNHDQTPTGDADGTTAKFNQYFGSGRFQGRPYYGGHYGSSNDNSYALFTSGGLKFIVVFIEYDTSPDAAVLSWANNLLATYSDRRAIVASHYIINAGNPGSFSGQGQAIYNALKGNANLFLMLCGHVTTPEGRRADTYNGHTVYSILSDYQERTHGGDGWLRIYEFSPSQNVIRVRTYSPTLGRFEADADSSSQFTLPYDMTAGTTFQPVATTSVPSGSTASVSWNGLASGTTYEWYAVASDGARTATSPIWRFTTGSSGNLVANSGFENNLNGWSSYGGSSLSQATEGHSGSRSLRMQGPSSTGFFGTDDEPNTVGTVPGAGAVYRFSAWVKSTSGSTGKAKLRIYEFLGSTQQGSTFYSPEKTLSSSWQFLTVDYTVRTAGTTLSLRVSDEPVANSESFLVDDVSVTLVNSAVADAGKEEFLPPPQDQPVLSASIRPNPMAREGALDLALTRPGFARGELFDATGRRVGSLFDEPNLTAGHHQIPIAPRGSDGGSLPTGMYFYRVETGEGVLHGRIVVID